MEEEKRKKEANRRKVEEEGEVDGEGGGQGERKKNKEFKQEPQVLIFSFCPNSDNCLTERLINMR